MEITLLAKNVNNGEVISCTGNPKSVIESIVGEVTTRPDFVSSDYIQYEFQEVTGKLLHAVLINKLKNELNRARD